MAGVSGYKFFLVIGGAQLDFQNLNLDHNSPPLEASSRLNADGFVNGGFSARALDLTTLTMSSNSLVRIMGDPPELGQGINVIEWAAGFDGITLYSGDQLYVQRFALSGSIPGNGMASLLMYAQEDFIAWNDPNYDAINN